MQTALAAVFVFLLVILLHELGHFTVAKLVGIRVNEFSIGMGPKLLQSQKGETKYTLRLLPIGGYVQMEGEDEESSDPRGFSNAGPWARMAVIAAGAIMNFVLAFIVLTIVSYNVGTPTTVIDEVINQSPAQEAGILPGDKIIKIDDSNIKSWNNLTKAISKSDGEKEMEISYLRDGIEENIAVKPIYDEGRPIIGIVPSYESTFFSSIRGGFQYTSDFIKLMFEFIGMLFRGQVRTEHLSGPVGVISEVGEAAKMGMSSLLLILGFISVNLGFFNLLPIPALDGSRMIFIAIELILGKPIDPEKEGLIHTIGLVFLLGLMLIITYRDIRQLFI